MWEDEEADVGERDGPTLLEAGGTNAIGRMLGLLGDEWTLLILQHSLWGVRRYGQLMTAIPISNAVLTSRLRLLTQEDMLERRTYQRHPPRAEYRPTARSRSLWRVLLSIWAWERQWVPDHADRLPIMRHATCGSDFTPVLGCEACGAAVRARNISVEWGPSGSWPRSVPHASTRRRSEVEGAPSQSGMFPDTMAIFGNRWSSALLGAAFRGLTRFSEFESSLGAPPTLIADRLRVFLAIGVLEPVDNPGRSDRTHYRLTPKGRGFFPVVAMSLQWADRWFQAPEGPALDLRHTECGQAFRGVLRCDQCAECLAGADVLVATGGPGARPRPPAHPRAAERRVSPPEPVRRTTLRDLRTPPDSQDEQKEHDMSWATIRQVVIGAEDLEATTTQLRGALGLAPGFADPLLEDIGLGDETIRVGDQAHLEVVAPLAGETSMSTWLAKGGGGGGYALSIQVPDAGPLVERAAGLGVRVAADLEAYGRRIVQLHPGDMGLLVELDEIPEPGEWFWDHIETEKPEAPLVDDVLGVDVQSPDPAAQAARWAGVFGVEVTAGDVPSIQLGARTVHFVRGDRRMLSAVDLSVVAGADAPAELVVSGVALRLHRDVRTENEES